MRKAVSQIHASMKNGGNIAKASSGSRWALCFNCKSQFIVRAYCPRYSGELRNTVSELEAAMNQVQIERKSYQMPPRDGFTVAHFLTVADIERSARFYETVFGGRIL